MIISKAIEILHDHAVIDSNDLLPDTSTAIRLGEEALKHIQNCREHPAAQMYLPLPGETKVNEK